jgi:hypothetical protein
MNERNEKRKTGGGTEKKPMSEQRRGDKSEHVTALRYINNTL